MKHVALIIIGAIAFIALVFGVFHKVDRRETKKVLAAEIQVRAHNDSIQFQQIAELRQKNDSLEREVQRHGKRLGSLEKRTTKLEKTDERLVGLLVIMTDTIVSMREQKEMVKVAPKKKGKNKPMSLEEALEDIELSLKKGLSK